jgi:hypothetical protein
MIAAALAGGTRSVLPHFHSEMMTRREEISTELIRLLADQTTFLRKIKTTPTEREEYQQSLDRMRMLFAELAR